MYLNDIEPETNWNLGLPHSSFFPYDTLEAKVALPEQFEPTPNKPNSLDSISEQLAALSLCLMHLGLPTCSVRST
jgi:hypothetical protein